MKINSVNTVSTKPVVVVEAAINPRDWITIPTAMNVVDKLLGEEQRLLDDYEWIVIPVANPDGYEYTHTNVSMSLIYIAFKPLLHAIAVKV